MPRVTRLRRCSSGPSAGVNDSQTSASIRVSALPGDAGGKRSVAASRAGRPRGRGPPARAPSRGRPMARPPRARCGSPRPCRTRSGAAARGGGASATSSGATTKPSSISHPSVCGHAGRVPCDPGRDPVHHDRARRRRRRPGRARSRGRPTRMTPGRPPARAPARGRRASAGWSSPWPDPPRARAPGSPPAAAPGSSRGRPRTSRSPAVTVTRSSETSFTAVILATTVSRLVLPSSPVSIGDDDQEEERWLR